MIEVAILGIEAADVDALWQLLAPDERERAMRYRFEADRRRSIVARGSLRSMLGRRLGLDPRGLRFTTGKQGKPALAGNELEFNVSHSGDRVAIAIAEGTPVGIDVELEQPRMNDVSALARRFFSPLEADAVERDKDLFFTIWTAKEAVIKALGGGLSIELASFSIHPVGTDWSPVTNLDGWRVAGLAVGGGYKAAVAAWGEDHEVVRV